MQKRPPEGAVRRCPAALCALIPGEVKLVAKRTEQSFDKCYNDVQKIGESGVVPKLLYDQLSDIDCGNKIMTQDRPYYRTVRPFVPADNSGWSSWQYMRHPAYAVSPQRFVQGYLMIQKDWRYYTLRTKRYS